MGLLPDDHVYSYSQLSSFDQCAYGFYLQRIEGLEEEASNAFAERGSLIHDLLDQWAKKILTKEDMLKQYEERYGNEVVTSFPPYPKGFASKQYDLGLQFLKNFDEFEGYEIINSEEKFKINLPLSDGTTRPFVGVIDLMLKEKATGHLVICDHKSKSLQSFRRDEDKMYRQQILYSCYVLYKYGKYPDALMFHLFNNDGLKPQRFFSQEEYNKTIEWATNQIQGIENYSTLDWLMCKETPDYFCWNLCSARKQCPNGVQPKRRKKTEEYEGYNEET